MSDYYLVQQGLADRRDVRGHGGSFRDLFAEAERDRATHRSWIYGSEDQAIAEADELILAELATWEPMP